MSASQVEEVESVSMKLQSNNSAVLLGCENGPHVGNVPRSTENPEQLAQNKKPKSRCHPSLLRKTSLHLIENSTICVFQWNKSWYRCFICKEAFQDMTLLRQHSVEHPLKHIEDQIIAQQNRMIKAEISKLFCKLCEKKLHHLTELREHLTQDHQIRFDADEDLLIPFKIEAQKLKCQICDLPFHTFRLLNLHMNKHYQKHVCHICGSTFSNLVFLNLHKTRSHRSWRCKDCDIVFGSRADKRHHDVSVHKVTFERKLRFPCPFCEDRFSQENFRAHHLVEAHGTPKPEYKCEICTKVFITRSLCNNHVKNVHQKEKSHECDICHHLFYTKSDVKRHRVTHTREKKFSCESCNALFTTKDSLRRHMKRTHLSQ
ncbi:PR domain zinc finger protein 5-like [Battus philenor]|uniref:PR domain zinc finger protein 5-like n=1 Tax=Battus philenor TaxID=42288 RepID=UPI0035CF5731